MKRSIHILAVMLSCAFLISCNRSATDCDLLQRSFFNETWERFDYVRNNVEIKAETTYDLSLRISFTDAYPYDEFSMVFTVFDAHDNPYRSRGYKFKLKDGDGHWKSQPANGCYTFELPINKQLLINDPGTYCFQIEQTMPITPLVGVKELTLYSNEKTK